MYGLLADVSLSLPDATSPWFFWAVPFGIAVLCFVTCFTSAFRGCKAADRNNTIEGYIATSVVSGIIGVVALIYSGVIFLRIFDTVLPAATG